MSKVTFSCRISQISLKISLVCKQCLRIHALCAKGSFIVLDICTL